MPSRRGEGVAASERSLPRDAPARPQAPLEIAGIACGAAAKPIDRFALACILDKLNYSAGSDNKALNDFFLNAELARGKGCANVSRDDLTASIPPRAKPAAPAKPRRPCTRGKRLRESRISPAVRPERRRKTERSAAAVSLLRDDPI